MTRSPACADHAPTSQGAIIPAVQQELLAYPPTNLLSGASLFLDFDGTLVDLIDRPDEVTADAELRALLLDLHTHLDGRLAIVSGRSLAQLDLMLGSLAQTLSLSGSHGSEHRWRGIDAQPRRPVTLDTAGARLRRFAERHDGMLVEEKSFGIALHFRGCPDRAEDALRIAFEIATELDLRLQAGKMVVELRIPGGGKDIAVRRLMGRPPMSDSRPVFIGDDLTDEPAFEMVGKLGGAGILVGPARHDTRAQYRLEDATAVRAWLRAASA